MTRAIHRLGKNYRKLPEGLHCDGGGLHLSVTVGIKGSRRLSWIFRFARNGKTRDAGLGSANTYTLPEARERARKFRQLLDEGQDPIVVRDAARLANMASSRPVLSFDEASAAYITAHQAEWSSVQHGKQWSSSLRRFASPIIGRMNVADITTQDILRVLTPIWPTKTETASRLRARIELVLGWATTAGHRPPSDNPARWEAHLENLLSKPTKRDKRHMPALPYDEMVGFWAELGKIETMPALALRFVIATAVRSQDVRDAKVADIDRRTGVWKISSFSKSEKPLDVPLSNAALAVLDAAEKLAGDIGVGDSLFLFPASSGSRLAVNAMLDVIDGIGLKHKMTPHGARSAFRTWGAEKTNVDPSIIEMSLGHVVGSAVERAYQRGQLIDRRRELMNRWASFLTGEQEGVVVPMHGRRK